VIHSIPSSPSTRRNLLLRSLGPFALAPWARQDEQ
jgi:hypothetical protein